MDTHHIPFLELLHGQVQYVVPRWQRRYSWGHREIERLVEDLMTVATAGSDAGHYGSQPRKHWGPSTPRKGLTSSFGICFVGGPVGSTESTPSTTDCAVGRYAAATRLIAQSSAENLPNSPVTTAC